MDVVSHFHKLNIIKMSADYEPQIGPVDSLEEARKTYEARREEIELSEQDQTAEEPNV